LCGDASGHRLIWLLDGIDHGTAHELALLELAISGS
jgi:hypothetical protein